MVELILSDVLRVTRTDASRVHLEKTLILLLPLSFKKTHLNSSPFFFQKKRIYIFIQTPNIHTTRLILHSRLSCPGRIIRHHRGTRAVQRHTTQQLPCTAPRIGRKTHRRRSTCVGGLGRKKGGWSVLSHQTRENTCIHAFTKLQSLEVNS